MTFRNLVQRISLLFTPQPAYFWGEASDQFEDLFEEDDDWASDLFEDDEFF